MKAGRRRQFVSHAVQPGRSWRANSPSRLPAQTAFPTLQMLHHLAGIVRPLPIEWGTMDMLNVVVSIDGLQPDHDVRRAPIARRDTMA